MRWTQDRRILKDKLDSLSTEEQKTYVLSLKSSSDLCEVIAVTVLDTLDRMDMDHFDGPIWDHLCKIFDEVFVALSHHASADSKSKISFLDPIFGKKAKLTSSAISENQGKMRDLIFRAQCCHHLLTLLRQAQTVEERKKELLQLAAAFS